MKILKRMLLAVFVALMICAFVACGDDEPEKSATGISVTAPAKTEYLIGEELDTAGLTAKLLYDDGSEETLTLSQLIFSGFSSSEAGQITVTVTYQSFKDTFTVTITDSDEIDYSKVTGIRVTPPTKTQYLIGEQLDLTGVTAVLIFKDNTEKEVAVSELDFSGFSSDEAGEVTVTVSFRDYEDKFTVTVSLPEGPIDVTNVKFEDKSVTYNGTEIELTASGVPNGVLVRYENNTRTNAGSGEASVTLTGAGGVLLIVGEESMEEVVLTATLTVSPAVVTVNVKQPLYETGEALTPKLEFSGIVGNEEPEYTVFYTPEEVVTAGNYTLTVTFTGGNYTAAEPVSFSVTATTVLDSPVVRYNNGNILIVPQDHSSGFAYSYNGIDYEAVGEDLTVDVSDLVGARKIYVKALPESAAYRESLPTEHEFYQEGTLLKYDFASADNGVIADKSGNGVDLVLKNSYSVADSALTLDNSSRDSLGIAQSPSWMQSTSMTIELVARIDSLNTTPNTGYADNALLFKTGEYYIGFWSDQPDRARLLMWLGSESNPDLFYDDFSLWLPIKNIVDGNYHQFAITYNGATGQVSYYMDYICLNTITRTPSNCSYTGNELLLGAWGNGADVTAGTAVHYANATYDYLEIKNYAAVLTPFYGRTGSVIAESKTELDYTNGAIQYLTQADDKPQFGSMSLSVTFSLTDPDSIPAARYTLAFRDLGIHLYIIKTADNLWFGQCYIYTTGSRTEWGQKFLDFGQIFIADGQQHTMSVSFDALTGSAYGRIDDIHYDWMVKDFGGSLINPSLDLNQAMPLYIGGTASGEVLPAANARIHSFLLSSDPTLVIL